MTVWDRLIAVFGNGGLKMTFCAIWLVLSWTVTYLYGIVLVFDLVYHKYDLSFTMVCIRQCKLLWLTRLSYTKLLCGIPHMHSMLVLHVHVHVHVHII